MKTDRAGSAGSLRIILPILGILSLAACDGDRPTGPGETEAVLSFEDQIVLAVLADSAAVEAGVALAEAPVTVFEGEGTPSAAASRARGELTEARLRFAAAGRALDAGDDQEALREARIGRELVIRTLESSGGTSATTALVERAEALSAEVAADPAAFDDPQGLQQELDALAAEARLQASRGDLRGAAGAAVVAEQRRHQRRRHPDARPGRARIAVELGATAVELAHRLVDEATADPVQLRFLRHATEFQRRAQFALAEGHPARAVHFAELATWSSLKAVVLPGGVSEEEARAMADLAREQFVAALATDPQGIKGELLQLSRALLDRGLSMLEAGHPRGVAPLWASAVISTWILS